MRWRRKYSALAAAILLSVMPLCTGCNTSGCLENRNAVPLAGFYGSDSTSISLDSILIAGLGAPEDKPLSEAGKKISQIYLPMRSTQQSTTWIFAYKWQYLDYPEACDTLTLHYSSMPYFVSDECGVIFKYGIESIDCTKHLIEGVQVVDSLVTNVDKEYLKIYFRTAQEEPDEQ